MWSFLCFYGIVIFHSADMAFIWSAYFLSHCYAIYRKIRSSWVSSCSYTLGALKTSFFYLSYIYLTLWKILTGKMLKSWDEFCVIKPEAKKVACHMVNNIMWCLFSDISLFEASKLFVKCKLYSLGFQFSAKVSSSSLLKKHFAL